MIKFIFIDIFNYFLIDYGFEILIIYIMVMLSFLYKLSRCEFLICMDYIEYICEKC